MYNNLENLVNKNFTTSEGFGGYTSFNGIGADYGKSFLGSINPYQNNAITDYMGNQIGHLNSGYNPNINSGTFFNNPFHG